MMLPSGTPVLVLPLSYRRDGDWLVTPACSTVRHMTPHASDASDHGTVLLTGGTGGLGRALLEPLARRRPAHLILLGRSPEPLAAAARLARDAGARRVTQIPVDLADLESVAGAGRAVTALVLAGAPPLGALLLNAGLQMAHRRHTSAQGLELTFAVNVVAQHLLLRTTETVASTQAHTVLTGSGTHYGDWHSYASVPPPAWQDPAVLAHPDTDRDPPVARADAKDGPRAYATSKLGVLYLAHAWQAHCRGRRFNVFDPGLMPGTGLGRELSGPQLWAWHHLMPALTFLPGWSTPRRAARPLADLALGDTHPDLKGGYVELDRARASSPASYDPAREQRLWQVLHDLTDATANAPTEVARTRSRQEPPPDT